MKRLFAFLIVLTFLSLSVPAAYAAESNTYELPELSMAIEMPEGWVTFTREIDADDPNLAQFNTTAEALINNYKANSIYLNSICIDPLSEIVITMVSDKSTQDIYDFNRISEEEMSGAAETIRAEMQELLGDGATYTQSGVYMHAQAKFVVLNFEKSGELSDHAQQYTTIINGKTINVTLHSYSGQLTAAQEQLLNDVVDSITFTKVTKKPWLNFSHAITNAIIGGIIGVIIVTFVKLFKKRKRQKTDAESSTVYLYTNTKRNSDDPPYLK